MELSFTEKKSIRKSFGKLKESLSIPNLIEVQKNSYDEFLISKSKNYKNDPDEKGLLRVFKSIFPINDTAEKSSLEFISYRLSKPKFDVTECRQRSLTYSAAIKANLRLVVYEIDPENNTKQILSAKEQEVYIGDLPLMTPSGTFVVNGVERVVLTKCIEAQEFSLIMIKEKPTLVENFYLTAELFQAEVPGWILNLILKICYILELIERKKFRLLRCYTH